jgi:prepilin-type N-terminal cleavage/methylation domain-containing protein
MTTSTTGRPRRSSARGFTVTELLVVMVIMALLAGLAVPSFARSLQSERLRTGARTVVSMVQLARTRAITRHTFTRLRIDYDEGLLTIEELSQPDVMSGRAGSMASAESRQPTWVEQRDSLGRPRSLPGGVRLTYAGGDPTAGAGSATRADALTFRPDGSTDDAMLMLQGYQGERLGVAVQRARLQARLLTPEEMASAPSAGANW